MAVLVAQQSFVSQLLDMVSGIEYWTGQVFTLHDHGPSYQALLQHCSGVGVVCCEMLLLRWSTYVTACV